MRVKIRRTIYESIGGDELRCRIYIFVVLLFVITNMLKPLRGTSSPPVVSVSSIIQFQVSGGVNVQSGSESDKLEYGSKEWHREKKKLHAMLWAGIVIVTILFTGIILVTIIRMGRHYRKRVTEDKKAEPTEYVDAWSQYRLKEDHDE